MREVKMMSDVSYKWSVMWAPPTPLQITLSSQADLIVFQFE